MHITLKQSGLVVGHLCDISQLTHHKESSEVTIHNEPNTITLRFWTGYNLGKAIETLDSLGLEVTSREPTFCLNFALAGHTMEITT